MRIVVSSGSPLPIYEQIREQIERAILSGDVSAGDPLPSIRQLASDLRVSVITTTRAYSDLTRDGYVVSVPGKGVFVQQLDPAVVQAQARTLIAASFAQAVGHARLAGIGDAELAAMLDTAIDTDARGVAQHPEEEK